MLIYILKFSCCLAIFLAFYKLALEKTSVHKFKRIYLLTAICLALIIPELTFTTYTETTKIQLPIPSMIITEQVESFTEREVIESPVNFWPFALYGVYFIGLALFATKFFINFFKIILRIKRNPKLKEVSLIKVLLREEVIPHTFLKYVFYNRKKFINEEIPKEVIWHEEIHAKQLHSVDVLLIELLQVVFWFNPLIRLTKNYMKLNHEYLADRGVLEKGVKPGLYQQIVLAFAINKLPSDLVNAFQFSFIKKRFTIMKTRTTKRAMVLRCLLLLPLVSLTLFSFSSRNTEVLPSIVERSEPILEEVILMVQDEGLTTLEEYNKLARQYKNYPPYDFVTKAKDMYRMWTLHEQLTASEKTKAEPYFRSTSTLTIFITNDGKYLMDGEEEVSIESLESIFKQLTAEEMSEAYAFSDETDVGRYVRDNRARNMSLESLNHIYINLYSEEFVHGKVINKKPTVEAGEAMKKLGVKFVAPALVNPKLKTYVDDLHQMFRKYGIKVDYD
ncbi:M56 family metallopeptidase [Roseivirga sp. E12]|uniref:M56 family metallopeptidase n=1 Tax=Roseivirga sp. E12 TaxID=2819237 RepID=UPI001ABCF4BD|nr:M56 family metallopeptidase [Roseivirga sp. E12]MBO3697924.1 hypothetical protein [Roseivirga sp. E12]